MNIAAFYHVYAHGQWQVPLGEFLETLERANFTGPLYLGIVGSSDEIATVLAATDDRVESYRSEPVGYEQVTLDGVREYALCHDGAILYAHTKGAGFVQYQPFKTAWRRLATERIVGGWRTHVVALDFYDIVKCSGNFWVARCSYLRQLPICSRTTREEAEYWTDDGCRMDISQGMFPDLSPNSTPIEGSVDWLSRQPEALR